jgi:muramoyltetrapeptide carboxypeptidase
LYFNVLLGQCNCVSLLVFVLIIVQRYKDYRKWQKEIRKFDLWGVVHFKKSVNFERFRLCEAILLREKYYFCILYMGIARYLYMAMALCFLLLTAGYAQRYMVMPAFLNPGDSIAVISPSSSPDSRIVEAGCRALRQWGYVPVVGSHAIENYHGFAGPVSHRTEDLLWALRDSTIRAIMCTRGGDGGVQLLPFVDTNEFRRHPKWIIGFSDITAIHSASVQAGVMGIHGPMCQAIAANGASDSANVVLKRLLTGQLPEYHAAPHRFNNLGTAEGMLVGGNFSVFCGLAGSPYDFLNSSSDLILFIEDTDESMTKVDRMLHLLEVRGVLSRLKGIVVGKFTHYKYPDNGFSDMYEMLHEYLQHYDIPVCYGFPVGHSRLNLPMSEGCHVRLAVTPSAVDLRFIGN